MGSDKRKGRNNRPDRRSSDPRRGRVEAPWVELLENRRLLTLYVATSTDLYDVQHGPMANLGASLIDVYHSYANYVNSGSSGTFVPALHDSIQFRGTSVGVDVRGLGNFAATEASLTGLGMTITATSASNLLVEGFIPIAQLPKLATLSTVANAQPMLVGLAKSYQGVGNNESVNTLMVPTSIQATGTAGAGQSVGVLSTSLSEFEGGLADSVKTGDLPSNVYLVPGQDELDANGVAEGGSDEGRAMLEQIHDIAPGASLGFASAFNGEVQFASNIQSLYSAGYKTIVDDVGYADEPAFQDGVVSQAVNTITAAGGIYLSSAGNASDDGYLSSFRGVNTTVGTLGAGRYMNFNASGGTTTQLGVYVPNDTATLNLQFDQPVGQATSDITAYLLDSSGNIAFQGIANTAATGDPIQTFVSADGSTTAIPAGTYTVVIKVNSGADPGHVFLYNFSDGDLAFDHSLGSAGGTYYPTTFGHAGAANTISVGAVPYYGEAPYLSRAPTSEPYSSFGPVISVFNPDGTPKAAAQTLLKPDISAPDGNNTSFFEGDPFPTTEVRNPQNPVYPGNPPTTTTQPTTPTNDSQNLPSFFGTSSAAPNLAAVVAHHAAGQPECDQGADPLRLDHHGYPA